MILAPCADAGTAKNSVAPSAAIVTATLARIVPGPFRTLPASLGSAVGHTFVERDRRFPGTRGEQGCTAEFADDASAHVTGRQATTPFQALPASYVRPPALCTIT